MWKDRMNIFAQSRLKKVKDWENFQKFLKDNKIICELRSKRSGRRVFGFSQFENKIHYLIDDGISTGLCKPENLYKYIYAEKI